MATQLQKQLAQIAENSKTILNAKAQKAAHSKSLIWEPKEAATQTFHQLYPVCHEGFEDLCSLDSRYEKFSHSLFSPQSQDEDRTQLTEEENRRLDERVEEFLRLVGGRIRLMPAIKAVEWLIRRFRYGLMSLLWCNSLTDLAKNTRVQHNGCPMGVPPIPHPTCLFTMSRAATRAKAGYGPHHILIKKLMKVQSELADSCLRAGSLAKRLSSLAPFGIVWTKHS